jgi:hypothetical protein
LTAAGFDIYKGVDAAGLASLYFTRGGGYYIDVGCSRLIAEGKIKVHRSPDGIRGFKPHALVLADGTELEADIVVLATGYDNMRTTVRKVLGDQVADRCKDVWDLDDEGEMNAVSTSPGAPCADCFLMASFEDMAAVGASKLLVHGWESCALSHVFQVSSVADQGY